MWIAILGSMPIHTHSSSAAGQSVLSASRDPPIAMADDYELKSITTYDESIAAGLVDAVLPGSIVSDESMELVVVGSAVWIDRAGFAIAR